MARARGTNGEGVLVDTLHYRFRGVELDNGTMTVDGVDPADVARDGDDEEASAPRPRPGKVIDRIVPIEVRLHKSFSDDESGPNRSVKSISFRLCCANPKFAVRGTDLEVMRKAVWDFLDQEFAVKWTPYFLVKIEPAYIHRGQGKGLEFTYERIQRGQAHDGTLLMRQWSYSHRSGYEVSTWPGSFRDKQGKLLACIPDTKENAAALEQFCSMIDQLRERLAMFFRPEQIAATLADLGGLKMLGADPTAMNEGEPT